jgi:hypothetical protein
MHLDATRVTEFLAYWQQEGITFALLPLQEAPVSTATAPEESEGHKTAAPPAQPVAKTRHVRGAAEKLHASGLLAFPMFWAYLEGRVGRTVGSVEEAHEAVKQLYGLASLGELSEKQADEVRREWLRWKRTQEPAP